MFGWVLPSQRRKNDKTWGMGWKKPQLWMQQTNYNPEIVEQQDRIVEFLAWHPDPKETIARLRSSMPAAGVGRDMQAMTPGVAYIENSGFCSQLTNPALTREDFEDM